MKRATLKKAEIVELTRKVIRSFYQREIQENLDYVHDDFVWIGALDFQFAKSKQAFLKLIESEMKAEPFQIFDEEYTLLTRDRNTIVVYGRFRLLLELSQEEQVRTHTRITAVWQHMDGALYLMHVHGSNAQDVPIQMSRAPIQSHQEVAFFEYLNSIEQTGVSNKLSFREVQGKYHFFLPNEVMYLKANGQGAIVYTKDQEIKVSNILAAHIKRLPDTFLRIHKSYVVHQAYVESLCRYTITLTDGTTLPVGKERYMNLKRILQGGENE